MALIFTVPGQPQGKGRPRVGKVGQHVRMFTPAKTANYENLVAYAAQQAMAETGAKLFEGPVKAALQLTCQVPASWSAKKRAQALAHEIRPTTKPDVDNVVKAVFDAINGVAWRDDVQVVALVVRKFYGETPGVRVHIDNLGAGE